jgi:hypothetical protein
MRSLDLAVTLVADIQIFSILHGEFIKHCTLLLVKAVRSVCLCVCVGLCACLHVAVYTLIVFPWFTVSLPCCLKVNIPSNTANDIFVFLVSLTHLLKSVHTHSHSHSPHLSNPCVPLLPPTGSHCLFPLPNISVSHSVLRNLKNEERKESIEKRQKVMTGYFSPPLSWQYNAISSSPLTHNI